MSTMSRAIVGAFGVFAAVAAGYLHLSAAAPGRPDVSRMQVVAPQPSHVPAVAPSAGVQAASAGAANPERELLNKYCVACHNQRLNRATDARITLDTLDVANVGPHAELWEKVVRKLRTGSMPPAGMPRPDADTFERFISLLEVRLDDAAAARASTGRSVPHRLNRLEYANAVRDLLGIEIEVASMLPTDESGYGFDNIGSVLSMTPGLLERYLFAAQRISRQALGDPTLKPVTETFKIRAWPTLVQDERMNDDLPFGSRGGASIRHHFPLDGEYVIRVTMQRDFANNGIMGIENRERLDVRLDGQRIAVLEIGGECVNSKEPRCIAPPGVQMNSEYEQVADKALQVRFTAKAGSRDLGIAFLDREAAMSEGTRGGRRSDEMAIASIELAGPFNGVRPADSPSRRRIFSCYPENSRSEEACAKTVLTTLARRAYRGMQRDSDVESLLQFYRAGHAEAGFEGGIRFALERLLVSPQFLFRIERDPATASSTPTRLSDLELASRLSFFLWNSIPDDQLLATATAGRLKDPQVFDQQVQRLLSDRRSTQSLVNTFAAQWLMLRDLKALRPDPVFFPDFTDNLREAFLKETELFLESQLREDRSIIEMLTANYTFVNERLARFYGIPNVYGSHFRRVTLPAETNRAGLLGQGSILTLTSYSTRTSPVQRGKYVLTNLLGSPPPPPPPNIPALEEAETGKPEPASVRERMQQHRANPVCASCHSQMDPIGFALENFDGVGKWRTRDGKTAIDASSAFPDGTKFNGPTEFRAALLTRRNAFVRTFTEKLLTYALGRGTDYQDMPAVRKILRDAERENYRWSSLISGVVKSAPFQMRAAQPPAAPQPATTSTSAR